MSLAMSMLKRVFLPILLLGSFCGHPSELFGRKSQQSPFPSDIHVILIGFDGWGSYCLEKADMPNVKRMMRNGAWTINKRSVLPSSSAANWASMFMGASPEIHGYTQWNSQKPEIPSRILGDNNIFPTISQLLHSQHSDARIALFYQWDGIKYVADTLSINHVAKLPRPGKDGSFGGISKIIGKYIIDEKPVLCTIVYDYPDHYGHASGFESDDYYMSLKEVDSSLGDIIQSTKEAGIYEKTIFIVSSDHGGIGKNHGGKSLAEMESPFIMFGLNVNMGYEIQESVMQYDIAATIAYIFGLETPQAWIGRPIFSIFKKNRNKK